ncbi:MFS transporter [Chloroflexota bacterium]
MPKIYYGWFVVAACFVVGFVFGGAFWSFGVYFKPLENEFGWTRALTSSGYTAYLIGYAISVVSGGQLSDRYSPRPVLLGSAILVGLGLVLCSQISSVSELRIFFFIAGLGVGPGWSVPSSTVMRWFHGRPQSGLALSIFVAGSGLGTLVFAPLINYFILNYGWRDAYIIFGIIYFTIVVIAALVLKKKALSSEAKNMTAETNTSKSVTTPDWSFRRAVTNSAFLGLLSMFCLVYVSLQIISVHLIPLATDAGISATLAATAIGLMSGLSIPGRIISGLISNKIGWQKILAVTFFVMASSMLLLMFLRNVWMLYGFVFLFGMFNGIRIVAQVGIIGEFFGMRSVGTLIGISSAAANTVGAISAFIAGLIFDTTGSYFIAVAIMMGLLLVGGIIDVILRSPSTTAELSV